MLCAYASAWSGSWHFDDAANLGALAEVFGEGQISISAALQFVLSGDAGPLGRPLALLSFLVDGSSWLHGPKAMLYTNTLLHTVNGLLLLLCLLNLGRLREQPSHKVLWVAVFTSLIWLASPLLASSSLMVVQRMTVLSSTFMLLGVFGYLKGRALLVSDPNKAFLAMAISVGLATLLGVFTKEQAIMLPALIWIIEACLLPKPVLQSTKNKIFRAFKWLLFVLPTVVVFAYLFNTVVRSGGVYSGRDFDMQERLWTQSVILWDYLRLTFLPSPLSFGPFHDDYPIYQQGVDAALSLLAWIVVLLGSWALRKKAPLLLFASLWYLASHLVESSVIGLELYFEHRNYLAVIGPIYALVVGVYWLGERTNKLKLYTAGIMAYCLIVVASLYQVTSLFGQPALAAELWYIEHSHSSRATQYLAGELSQSGDIGAALRVLDIAADEHENSAALRLQGLQLACVIGEKEESLNQRYANAMAELPLAPKRFSITDTLNKLDNLRRSEACNGFLTTNKLLDLAEAALSNPIISGPAQERSNLHIYMALLFINERNLPQTMHHIIQALDATPTVPVLGFAVSVLHSAGLYSEAVELLDEHPPSLPSNPILKRSVESELNKLIALAKSKL